MVDADFFDINGNTKHLSDYSGKYLLLDFWSSGCGPCIMALPEMKEISETYSEKLTIVSISFDPDAGWKKAMATHDMPWVNIRDPKSFGGLAANYGVSGIPHYVIISPENKIVDKWVGYVNGLIKKKVSEHVK
jgi:thiol-disulfide isomerase/thioredoxin